MAEEINPNPVGSGEPAPDVAPPSEPPHPEPLDEPGLIRQTLQELVGFLGIRGRVSVHQSPEGWVADIRSRRASSVLIGRQGATIDALGHIVHLIVLKRFPHCPAIFVDVGGYRRRQEQYLHGKALAVARIVLDTGREMAVDLLTEPEFHIVRDALADNPQVRVHATGDGLRRNVVVSPVR
jgi:predicted RNA-binding protein Jag